MRDDRVSILSVENFANLAACLGYLMLIAVFGLGAIAGLYLLS